VEVTVPRGYGGRVTTRGSATLPTRIHVNGVDHRLSLEPDRALLEVLRDDLGLTGSHRGCESVACGACTILLDGEPVRACAVAGFQCDGATIETVESLRNSPEGSLLRTRFMDARAIQCGFCTPGMLMAATGLLRRSACPTAPQIRHALEGHLCRCTGYHAIVKAIEVAGAELATC